MGRLLLDTSILVGLCRSAEWALDAQVRFRLASAETLSFTSVVCKGELLALAEKLGWGHGRRHQLDGVLSNLPTLDLNHQGILRAYASIDAWTHGRSGVAADGTPPPKPARPMGQNDMWIAATAHAGGFTLLSADKDFEHLRGAWLQLEYIEPR